MKGRGRSIVAALVVVALTAWAGAAPAVDAPKWVAALYVEAQKAVGLRWMPAPGATGYKVLRSTTKGTGYAEIAAVAVPQHFDKDLSPGETYYYVLQAVAGSEPGPMSEEKSIAIPGSKVKAVVIPQWDKIVVQESTEFGKTTFKAGLFWKPSPGAVAYNVYRTLEPGKNYQLLTSASEPQYVDATVEDGKTYYYVVSMLDDSFLESPYSEERSAAPKKAAVKKAAKKQIKLVLAPRRTQLLWQKTKGDDNGDFKFWEAFDIAVDDKADLLYAPSYNTREIYVLNASTGDIVRTIGSQGDEPGKFLAPLGIGLDRNGTLYAADHVRQNVQVFDASGNFVREFKLVPPPELKDRITQPPYPIDVAVDGEGNAYVADRQNNGIWVYDDGGRFLRLMGEPGIEFGQIKVPQYIDVDSQGNLVVINANQTHVDTFDRKTGKSLSSWGLRKPAVGGFVFIAGFGFDKEGNILIADKGASSVQGFLRDGRYLFHLADEKGDGGAPIYTPKGMTVDGKNRVFVCEGMVDRITALQIIDPPAPPQEDPPEKDTAP